MRPSEHRGKGSDLDRVGQVLGKVATKGLDEHGMEIGLEKARMILKRRVFFEFQMEALGFHCMLHGEIAMCLTGGPEDQLGSC